MIVDTFPLEFPKDRFIERFPEFGDVSVYPDNLVYRAGEGAMMHITPSICQMPMTSKYRLYALFLMAAHILVLAKQDEHTVSSGEGTAAPGIEFKATIGTVTIERTKPNSFTVDDWGYWLNQTSYGRELLAYLETRAPIGVFLNTNDDSVRDLI